MSAIIVGKGKTAKFLKKKDFPNTILIGINQAILFIDEPDYLVINDHEAIEGINLEYFKKIKNIILPEYPHFDCKPNKNMKNDLIKEKLKNYFKGNYIIHNLHTTPLFNKNLITICNSPHALTSTSVALEYCCKFLKIKNIEFYGIGKENGYHSFFKKILTDKLYNISNTYTNKRINGINNNLNKIIKKYKISYKFN